MSTNLQAIGVKSVALFCNMERKALSLFDSTLVRKTYFPLN